MDRTSLNCKILGAVLAGVILGTALVSLSLSYRPVMVPGDPSQEYPTFLIGITGFAVAAVAYVIARLQYRKEL